MPIYEYTCKDCGSDFELLIRGDEKPVCPSCGKKHLTKSLSVPPIQPVPPKSFPAARPAAAWASAAAGRAE